MTLLSSDAPATMSRAAFCRSAVSSTTTGGLPGPAAMTFLPLANAAWTTPAPPVTTSSRIPCVCMSCCAVSIVGSAHVVSRLAGPPASSTASLNRDSVRSVTRFADGCALNTTAFPAEIMPMPLLMIVSDGFVDGVIEPMTPYGAGSVSMRP